MDKNSSKQQEVKNKAVQRYVNNKHGVRGAIDVLFWVAHAQTRNYC